MRGEENERSSSTLTARAYTVNRKNIPKCFVISSTKPDWFWWILYTLSWVNLPYSTVNVFHITWIMHLHYLVEQNLTFEFCRWRAIGTVNRKKTHTKMFWSRRLYKTRSILIKFCTYCPEYICHKKQYKCFSLHLNTASSYYSSTLVFDGRTVQSHSWSETEKCCIATLFRLRDKRLCSTPTTGAETEYQQWRYN